MTRLTILFLVTCLLISTGCDFNNPWDYSHPARISYSISGGFTGSQQETVIEESGRAELAQQYYPQKYVARYQLTANQLDSVKDAFDRADFIALRSKYEPKEPIVDGSYYSITYSSDGGSKTVTIESGAELPKGLASLLEQLYRTNETILRNPDAGTLLMGLTYSIKAWPFSDNLKLADHLEQDVHLNNTAFYRDIFNFLNQIGGAIYETVLLEGDHLYRVTFWRNGTTFEENIGSYFRVWEPPLRHWPTHFGFSLSDIPQTGRILDAQAYRDVRQFLNEYPLYLQLFIFDELKEDGKAVSLALLSGKPE